MWLLGLFALLFGGLAVFGTVLNKKEKAAEQDSSQKDPTEEKSEEKRQKRFRFVNKKELNGKKIKYLKPNESKDGHKGKESAEISPTDFGNDLLNQVIERTKHTRTETPKRDPVKKSPTLKDADSLIGENGLLYSYCMENASRLYAHRIKSLGSSIKYIRDHPEVVPKLVEKINSLEPSQYEDALKVTLEDIKENPKNESSKVVRDTLLAVMYTTGFDKERDAFLKRERAFGDSNTDFVEGIKDDRLRANFQKLVTTSKGKTEELSERAQGVDIDRVIVSSSGKPKEIKKLTSIMKKNIKIEQTRKAA